MSEISELLDAALAVEPAPGLQADAIAHQGRRRARRRRVAGMTSVACVTGLGVAIAAATVASGDQQTRPTPAGGVGAHPSTQTRVIAPVKPSTSTTPPTAVEPLVTEVSLPAIVERDLGVDLVWVYSRSLPSGNDIDLAAGIARVSGRPARHQYLNVQVTGPHSMITNPTCAQLSGNGPNGDGYLGPCQVRRLASGGWLVLRSAGTRNGNRITQAIIIRPDGSGITAESTNQAATAPSSREATTAVVSTQPPVTAERLSKLVVELAKAPVKF